jgi:hypothetical protein
MRPIVGLLLAALLLVGPGVVRAAAVPAAPIDRDPGQPPAAQDRPHPFDKQGTRQDDAQRGKKGLTPAQRKIDSHLREEIASRRGSPGVPARAGRRLVDIDGQGRALVEIRARVLTQLERKIERMKGTVVSSSLEHRSLIAWVPLQKIETLAGESTVSAIAPAPKSITVRPQRR